MKKVVGLIFLVCSFIVASQFSGHQSLVNLAVVPLFTAPATGNYFIQGNLSLPQKSTGSSASGVSVRVTKNNTTIYTGISGASGFAIPSLALVSGDVIRVALSSDATVDRGLNVIKGDVFFGNKSGVTGF
jgi:hypothetical protein